MPKENTHLYFADLLLQRLSDKELAEQLRYQKKAYLLGSIFPDSWYYEKGKSFEKAADRVHGRGSKTVSQLSASMLKWASTRGCQRSLAFAYGYITHVCLDRVFHPCIDTISGDYFDPNAQQREEARYRHRLFETALDAYFSTGWRLHVTISTSDVDPSLETFMREGIEVPPELFITSLGKQIRYNRFFSSYGWYLFARVLHLFRRKEMYTVLPLFYGHVQKEQKNVPQVFEQCATGDGRVTPEDLLESALALAEKTFRYSGALLEETGSRIDVPMFDADSV